MYAIIEDGGKQYKVEPGTNLNIELRDLEEGQTEILFDQVLYIRDEDNITVGQPRIDGATVKARLLGPTSGPKLHPLHYRRRKDSRSRTGHRQKYLNVEITEITS